MFKTAALKLTGWYLAIIMLLSIGCSLALYHVSSNELERSARRPVGIVNRLFGLNDIDTFNQQRLDQLNDELNHLKTNLLLFNLAVLVVGGGLSYMMARRTLEPIEAVLDAQRRFTSDASHELRTPLTSMQSEIEVTLRDKNLTKTEAINQLKSNLEEVINLRALSDSLLSLAVSGNQPLVKEPVSIAEVVEIAAEHTGAKKRLKIAKTGSKLTVAGDKEQLVQLITILLDNALKYSAATSDVDVSIDGAKHAAIVAISDKGQGIAARELPRIFERFYRADASRSKANTKGYGLGLAIAKRIADRHNASIEVRSSPSQGSVFRVVLPLWRAK